MTLKVDRDVFEKNIDKIGDRLGFIPMRITHEKFVVLAVGDGFHVILDELGIAYEKWENFR